MVCWDLTLGWSLAGPDSSLQNAAEKVNFIKSAYPASDDEVIDANAPMCHLCKNDFGDLYGDPCSTEPSLNDMKATEIIDNSLKLVDGKFCCALSWKSSDIKLGDNRALAEKRFEYLKRKFTKDPDLFVKPAARGTISCPAVRAPMK